MLVVPGGDGFAWKVSLTVIMSINQKGTQPGSPGSGDWSTPMYALSTDNSCATGVSIFFSMSMLAADNFVVPFVSPGLTRSWTMYGEITFNNNMPEWVPGTQYFLCFYNIGEGYPDSNAIGVYPTLTKIV
jgi:hypothetical protein